VRNAAEIQPESSDKTPMIYVVFQLLIYIKLTMHYQEVEAKLLSHLPKVGTGPTPGPPREELRLTLRQGRVWVEKHEIGEVASTEAAPARGTSNKAVYAAAAAKARGLLDILPGEVTVVLDADGETAYEHVIGLIDACKGVKIEAIEFAANPKFERYTR
jgi:biopolymer transport protein ExbD